MSKRTIAVLTLALGLPLAGCGDGTSVADAGTLTLMLTDAPGDLMQAIVTIERIELVGDGQPLVLRDVPFTQDLLALSNDVAALVEDVTIPGGTYAQLRFIIPEACIAVEQEDGSELIYASDGFECPDEDEMRQEPDGTLVLPSFEQTGIKVDLPGGALQVDGDSHILLVDFDVSQSFGHIAGQSGAWVMHPVIHADDISLTGGIVVELTAAGTVDLTSVGSSLADFQARVDTEAMPLAFTDGDGDGTYTATFLYLQPDPDPEYSVSVELRDGVSFDFTLDPTSPQSVTFASGEQATVAFEVTSASTP